jgi:hypothetical protein
LWVYEITVPTGTAAETHQAVTKFGGLSLRFGVVTAIGATPNCYLVETFNGVIRDKHQTTGTTTTTIMVDSS